MLGPATPAAQKRHPSGGKEWRFKFHAPAALEDEGQPRRFSARRSIRFPVERWQANSPPALPFVPASLRWRAIFRVIRYWPHGEKHAAASMFSIKLSFHSAWGISFTITSTPAGHPHASRRALSISSALGLSGLIMVISKCVTRIGLVVLSAIECFLHSASDCLRCPSVQTSSPSRYGTLDVADPL
jgi:hypothetical protein